NSSTDPSRPASRGEHDASRPESPCSSRAARSAMLCTARVVLPACWAQSLADDQRGMVVIMATIEVNAAVLYYEERGSGPPLLLVHSTGGYADIWSPVL